MKIQIYALVEFFTIAGCFLPQSDAIMEDKILEFLEELRNRMCYPLFGFPALDPFKIAHANFSMDNKYVIDFTASITEFRLDGLSNFNVTKLKISANPLKRSNFDIVLPLTSAKSLYTANGSLAYIVYLNGDDKLECDIEDLKLSISWSLKVGLSVGIRKLKIEIKIGNLFVNLGNLMEEPRLNNFVHDLINELGIELLNDLWLEAQDNGVTQYIENTINQFLGNYTLSDIMEFIGGLAGGEKPPFGTIPADCKTNVLA